MSVIAIWVYAKQPPSPAYFKQNPERFSFDYLYNDEEFVKTVRAILYEGMSKKEVDKIFVSLSGGQVSEYSGGDDEVRYFYRKENFSAQLNCLFFQKGGNASWKFEVRFSEEGRLTRFLVPGNDVETSLVLFIHRCI